MFYKTIFKVVLLATLFTLLSCSATKTITSPKDDNNKAKPAAKVETKSPVQTIDANDEIVVSLGDSKLTMRQLEWMKPNAPKEEMVKLAEWWLENEMLYEEAKKRGITDEPKGKFIADMVAKRAFGIELREKVQDAVNISDANVIEYYEQNKLKDPKLMKQGSYTFTHIRTATLADAQKILEKIKAGEDIATLAKQMPASIHSKKDGKVSNASDSTVEMRFGEAIYNALKAAKTGDIIGPIEVSKDAYEVVRLDEKVAASPLPLVKERLKKQLLQAEKAKALDSLLSSLKEQNAGQIKKSAFLTNPTKK